MTAIEPGAFRTDWAGRSLQRTVRTIEDYAATLEPLSAARAARSGKQPGDPRKAAQAILKVVASEQPPVHLLLGTDALGFVREKLKTLQEEINQWEALTVSTDLTD